MRIEKAPPEEAETLTSIAFAAKRHLGYPENWIQRWKEALTITCEYIISHPTYLAVSEGKVAGFCAVQLNPGIAFLDHLWVEPASMRRGIGRALFEYAESVAREAGASCIKIESDPHAEVFYRKMGAIVQGAKPAAMDEHARFLTLLRKDLR